MLSGEKLFISRGLMNRQKVGDVSTQREVELRCCYISFQLKVGQKAQNTLKRFISKELECI